MRIEFFFLTLFLRCSFIAIHLLQGVSLYNNTYCKVNTSNFLTLSYYIHYLFFYDFHRMDKDNCTGCKADC